jgi:alpha-L-arabinofuranosidase
MCSVRQLNGCDRKFQTLALSTLSRFSVVAVLLAQVAFGQMQQLNRQDVGRPQDMPAVTVAPEIKGVVKVTVDMDKGLTFMAPRAMAVNASVADANLTDPELPGFLRGAGITTLRYPGGALADNFHWSTNKPSNSQAPVPLRYGNYAPNTDFGHFVALIDRVGTTVITVNYGSNQEGAGGGEPAEAAAWVAYANGNPTDTNVIGKDSSGNDWQTVGYWASLRASPPLATDDGKNFLRISHPQPLNVKYWEVGNEVYKNGYYGGEGQEVDLHTPYPKDAKDNDKQRRKNPNLSPAAYGKAFLAFAKAMKAVDPRIKVGASLDSPLANKWDVQEWTQDPVSKQYVQHTSFQKAADSGLDWDRNVLQVAGKDIDFVALHWNAGNTSQASNWKELDNGNLLSAPVDELPTLIATLLQLFQKYCGQNVQNIQLLATDVGPKSFIKVTDPNVVGLFAADAYLSLMEDGAANIDWSDLHGGSFLNEQNKPGSAYFALQMIHNLLTFNETLVAAGSSHALLSVHAASHKNGSLSIMLINKDPKNNATVKVTVNGGKLAGPGMRFDYGRSNPPGEKAVAAAQIEEVGNSFTLTVPSYTITDVLIPQVH